MILDVKDEEYKIKGFILLDLKIFFGFYLFHTFNYEKKKGSINLKDKKQFINGNGKKGIQTLSTNNSHNGLAICRFS